MTNAPLDTQPALHSRNVSVRGGRLTKFKGQVASIAPGLSVVATAAVLFTGGAAQAANECGGDSVGQNTVTCAADANPTNPGVDPYANGITYNGSDGLTLILDDPDITVNGPGVQVNGTGAGDIKVHMKDGKVTTNSHGVSAFTTGSGSVHAQLDGLTSDDGLTSLSDDDITINRDSSAGLRARINYKESTETATATMTGGKITVVAGENADGVTAFTHGRSGAVTAEMSGGLIITEQAAGATSAIYAGAHETYYVGTVTAEMSGADSEIHTKNNRGHGLRATTRATSEDTFAVVRMKGGKITTEGDNAYAVMAHYGGNTPTDPAQRRLIKSNMTAKMTGGTIEALGGSTAIRAVTPGVGDALAEMDETDGTSTITTHGNQAHGLRAASGSRDSESEGTAKAIMKAGTIIINAINSAGAIAQANGGLGTALARMEDGRITINGLNSSGLYAQIDNEDNKEEVKVEMTGGSIETNSGDSFHGSHGLYAHTSGSGDVIVEMDAGTVTTHGRNSHGILAKSDGVGTLLDNPKAQAKGVVSLGEAATVMALGEDSDGIRVSGNNVAVNSNPDDGTILLGARGFDVDVYGSVTGGAGKGAAIRTISSARGEID